MKKLHLRREVLTELTGDQMRIVAAGTITYTCVPQSVATACGGQSCVCSIAAQCTGTCGCTGVCGVTAGCADTLLCTIGGS